MRVREAGSLRSTIEIPVFFDTKYAVAGRCFNPAPATRKSPPNGGFFRSRRSAIVRLEFSGQAQGQGLAEVLAHLARCGHTAQAIPVPVFGALAQPFGCLAGESRHDLPVRPIRPDTPHQTIALQRAEVSSAASLGSLHRESGAITVSAPYGELPDGHWHMHEAHLGKYLSATLLQSQGKQVRRYHTL
jgi:hypothetical protein